MQGGPRLTPLGFGKGRVWRRRQAGPGGASRAGPAGALRARRSWGERGGQSAAPPPARAAPAAGGERGQRLPGARPRRQYRSAPPAPRRVALRLRRALCPRGGAGAAVGPAVLRALGGSYRAVPPGRGASPSPGATGTDPFKRKAKAFVRPLLGEARERRALHTGTLAGRGCGILPSALPQHDRVPKQLLIVNRFIVRQSSGR
ncbi:collagen alpha-1(II) chain-like [Pipra filicauda]|uniref:Collagen alpha-1(II) chain-like n=1 Tax=Pipra filicauda TaxID=649802 RepID=A0A7R5KYJ4_9PASS|nr:collagen alpha-1(II) chain-like [Pipra filicauda]